jgi:hypothetical protein
MPSFMTQDELNRTATETAGAVVDQHRLPVGSDL